MIVNTKVFKALQGHWQLERIIPNYGCLQGNAYFNEIAEERDALHYQEKGILTLETGASLDAYREYIYRYQADEISIYFLEAGKSNRLLHTLAFDKPTIAGYPIKANAKHQCANDIYETAYEFFGEDEFIINYKVSGPTKNYTIYSCYKRFQRQ